MANIPGFFFSVDLGTDVLTQPDVNTDVSSLNVAVVAHDDVKPVPTRWSTWGLDADSLFLYQSQTDTNRVLVGNTGFIYRLDEKIHTDNGVPLPVTLCTSALPPVDETNVAATMKRTQEIKWSLRTPPPSSGITVTITLTDVDDATNTVTRTVTQLLPQCHVDLTIRARQFYIKFTVNGSSDFDVTYIGYSYQTMSTRKTTRLQ
jgi:hypothetical protein